MSGFGLKFFLGKKEFSKFTKEEDVIFLSHPLAPNNFRLFSYFHKSGLGIASNLGKRILEGEKRWGEHFNDL